MTTSTEPAGAAPAGTTPATGVAEAVRHPGRADARRFAWACAAGGALAMVVLAWFATRGFAVLFDRPYLGGFFDAQARALFDGRWDLPPDAATFERYNIDGKYHMYFGPTPALLRMPLLVLSDWFDGRLSRVSMIAACAVVVFGIARLSWLARRTVRGAQPVSRAELVVAASVVVAGSLGTVVPFVAGWTAVYHEAIQWGLAFALLSYGALVAWMLDRRARDLVVAGAAAALSLLARGSVGLGPVAAVGIVAAVHLFLGLRDRRAGGAFDWRTLGGLAAAVLVPVALYGYVNTARFGAPFSPPPMADQDLLAALPTRAEALAANGGNLFGIGYAPTVVYQYLRPDGLGFDRLFPWVTTQLPTRVLGGAVFDNLRPTASTTATAPLWLLLGLGGTAVVVVRRALRRVWLPIVAGAAVGVFGTVSVAFIDHRYQADLVPLLVVPGVVGVWALVAWLAGRARALVVTAVVVAVVLGAWSMWANLGTAYLHQRAQNLSSVDDRASLVQTQLDVQDLLGAGLPSRVNAGGALPERGDAGSLFVVGTCDGVYRHDGEHWLPVEQTPATGYHPLVVRLDPDARGRQPVLSSADDLGTTVIWARNEVGGDRVGFEYQWEPRDPRNDVRTSIPLGSVDRRPDGSIEMSVRIDPREGITDFLQVRSGDRLLLDEVVNKLHGPVELGVQETLPGATSLAGDIHRRPVDTPICDRLVGLGLRVA